MDKNQWAADCGVKESDTTEQFRQQQWIPGCSILPARGMAEFFPFDRLKLELGTCVSASAPSKLEIRYRTCRVISGARCLGFRGLQQKLCSLSPCRMELAYWAVSQVAYSCSSTSLPCRARHSLRGGLLW